MKYLPRSTDKSAYASVWTREPVTISERKRCAHLASTYFNFTDLRSDNMQRYSGTCCVSCGLILSMNKVE